MKIFFIVTANDFGSTKTNPSQSPKHHFFERLVTLRISGVAVSFRTGCGTSRHPAQAICTIVATRHTHAAP
jgi:hypothetical protein